MGGSQVKGGSPGGHTEIETTINKLKRCLKSHNNLLTDKGVKIGELAYASLGDYQYEVLKEISRKGLGYFRMPGHYVCFATCNITTSTLQ